MDVQTDINSLRPQMALRNVNSGNIFNTPLTSFAGIDNRISTLNACTIYDKLPVISYLNLFLEINQI